MTKEEMDEKEFEELWKIENGYRFVSEGGTEKKLCLHFWLASRRLLKEKQVRRDSNEPSDSYDD